MKLLRLVCVVLSLCAVTSMALEDPDDIVTNYTPYQITWKAFKTEYGRNYSEQEEQLRYNAFVEHLKMIEAHNKDYLANKTSFFMGIGPFADWIPEDGGFNCNVLDDEDLDGRIGRQKRQAGFCRLFKLRPHFTPPASLDWRRQGAVTPVGDQGECGSCYAFGAAATIEAQLQFNSGRLTELSKQQFVDCHNKNCDGSYAEAAFFYVYSAGGIMSAADYRYRTVTRDEGQAGPCDFNKSKVKAQVSGCLYSLGNETRLKYMVASQGPVYIRFAVFDSFRGYGGGVYKQANCNDNNPEKRGYHCLTVVGYDSVGGKDVWIVKNSWGTGWGGTMRGFAYIERGVNMCGIANKTTVPVIGGQFNRGKAVLTDTEADTFSPTGMAAHPLPTVSLLLLSCGLSLLNAN